jgi:chromosome segregation ATPase
MRETSRKGLMMDSERIEKRLSWFDEQRLKDAEALREIKESLSELERTLNSQAKQLESLSEETSRVAALAARIHKMDDALGKHRKEVTRQLEVAETRRSEKEKHLEALRKTDQEAIVKRIDQLRGELGRIDQLYESLENRRAEQARLNKEQDAISKRQEKEQAQLQEIQIQIKAINDSQNKDHVKLGKVDDELSEFKRRLDGTRHDLESLSDDIRRIDVKTAEMNSGEQEREERQRVFFDRQELKLVEFEKGWDEWEGRFSEFEQTAAAMNEKLAAYDETFRAARQLRESLEGLMERLERRITEVSEMQRLADERMKQEWNSFQADEQKRWNTFKLTNDEQWRDHERIHTRLEDHQEKAQKELDDTSRLLIELRERDEARVRELVSMIREWASAIDQPNR